MQLVFLCHKRGAIYKVTKLIFSQFVIFNDHCSLLHSFQVTAEVWDVDMDMHAHLTENHGITSVGRINRIQHVKIEQS